MSDETVHSPELEQLLGELESGLTPAQWESLTRLLRGNPAAQEHYLRHMTLHARLMFQGGAGRGHAVRAVTPPPTGQRIGRRGWLALRFAAAAVLVLGFVSAAAWLLERPARSVRGAGPQVATLVDATDAEWGPGDLPVQVGSPLGNGWMTLRSGTAEVEFVSGARVTLKGPARFGINSPHRAFLDSGVIRAYVPPAARGFTIAAPGCAVVDLGTEFSLSVDAKQSVVQVLKGRVRLDVVDDVGRVLRSEPVEQRHALQVDPASRAIRSHRFNPNPFDGSEPLTLELAEIVAGGDGAGSASGRGLDPRTGAAVEAMQAVKLGPGTPGYHRSAVSRMIDGVFVPAGGQGVQIDSRGGTFDGLPPTDRNVIGAIWGERSPGLRPFAGSQADWLGLVGDLSRFAPQGRGVVALHTNAGFTLDLAAVRAAHPGWSPGELRGVAVNAAPPDKIRRAEFWVVVDGRQMRRITLTAAEPSHPFTVPLEPSARFLTLIFTDGQDSLGFDWTMLGDAVIRMQPAAVPDAERH